MPRIAAVGLLFAVLFAAGCKVQDVGVVGDDARESIAYAARAKYPTPTTNRSSEKYQAAAFDDRGARRLEVYNLTDQAIPARAVWVGGTYVARISPIGPKGHATVKYGELLEAGPSARDLGSANRYPDRVELETDDGLVKVIGPAVRF